MTDATSFRITPSCDDYYAWQRVASSKVRARPFYKVFVWACAVAALVVALVAGAGAGGELAVSREAALDFLLVTGFFGVWYILSLLLSSFFQRSFYSGPSHFLSPYDMRLDAEGIHFVSEFVSSTVSWAVIGKVTETPDYVFLRLDETVWRVIPKRDLKSSPNFVQIIRSHLTNQN